ncbi:hypothetical protein GCM10027436_76780 [Actinophytocola sediminis]
MFLRKPLTIIGTLALAAATAIVVNVAPQWFSQVANTDEQIDELRRDAEIRTSVSKIWLGDEGRTMATPPDRSPRGDLLRALGQPGAAADEQVLNDIEQLGGIRAENLTLRMVLEGRRNQAIRITNIAPRIIKRADPLAGTLFYMPSQGGDESLRMLADLDESHPTAREATLDDTTLEWIAGSPYFDANTISLQYAEQHVVVLRNRSKNNHVQFVVEVTYLIGGTEKTLTIDDDGKPFEVTAMPAEPNPGQYLYEQMYILQGDFSLCRAVDDDLFSEANNSPC